MKKIIELAEKALDALLLPGSEITQEMTDALLKLSKAVKDRKTLEQTPITEDWLKEHGFKDEPQERMLIYRKGTFGIECDLTTWDWYWANGDVTLHSLADLYDAAELCGINLED